MLTDQSHLAPLDPPLPPLLRNAFPREGGRGSLHRLRLGRRAAGRIIEAVSEKFVQVASLQRVGEQREDVADVMSEISHRAELAEIGRTEQGRIMQIRLEFNVPFVPPAGVRKPIPRSKSWRRRA